MSAVLKEPLASLRFTEFGKRDVEAVAAIEKEVYVFPWTAGNFQDSLDSGYLCMGAFVQDELVAYAVLMRALDEAHLLNLAVSNRWQRQGIAARFLEELIDRSRALGCGDFYLEVRPSNVAARALYERFGFRQAGLRKDYYPAVTGREDALFLSLNIRKGRNW